MSTGTVGVKAAIETTLHVIADGNCASKWTFELLTS
jgi:hypothetical protein